MTVVPSSSTTADTANNSNSSTISIAPTSHYRTREHRQQSQRKLPQCHIEAKPAPPKSPTHSIATSHHDGSGRTSANSNAITVAARDNDDSSDDTQAGCHQTPSHLLGSLGPKMQTLLHKTIGSTSKTHRRLKSEMDFSWLPINDQDDTNNNQISASGPLKQSQSLLHLRSPRHEPPKRSKVVRMKLFHQRIDKLFDQRLLKQWSDTIRSPSNQFTDSPERRRQLELRALPEPIRNLLIQINSRGPTTVGIFRKSPSAKNCKELRQKLESDSQGSIQDFQVTVIASVFKEWLRSLPDCLLMSHLYPQWIDVAKLIEPLQQQQQQKQKQQRQQQQLPVRLPSPNQQASVTSSQLGRHLRQRLSAQPETDSTATQKETVVADDVRDNGDDSRFDKDRFPSPSLRPSRSSLAESCHQPLDRARSCSTMLADHHNHHRNQISTDGGDVQQVAIGNNPAQCNQNGRHQEMGVRPWRSLASFKLSERRSECLRFVRQLLDNLTDSNLVLLRAFISVLCRIAKNCEINKMSASNLGVCVGQSLLNDEQQSSTCKGPTKLSTYNFGRRLRRTRSYSILSSTFSQSNPNLKIDTAQETAKYVPILVTFMIENARQLFGTDIVDLFPPTFEECQPECATNNDINGAESNPDLRSGRLSYSLTDESTSTTSGCGEQESPFSFMDQVDCCEINSSSFSKEMSSHLSHQNETTTMRQSLVVNNRPVVFSRNLSEKRQESAYSSANSSSTSGVHSESPTFSNELDSQNNSRVTNSPRSSVSSPSSISSSISPLPDHQETNSTGNAASKQDDLKQANLSRKQVLSFDSREVRSSPLSSLYHYHTLASSTPKTRHRHSLPPNGFSPLMGNLLNRVPKLPVRLSTSSYGGEAIIYNPKPSSMDNKSTNSEYCIICPHDLTLEPSPESASISVKPLNPGVDNQQKFDLSRVITTDHKEVRGEERLSQFSAHQQRALLSEPDVEVSDGQQDRRRLQLGDASDVANQRLQASLASQRVASNSIQLPVESAIYYAHKEQPQNTLNYPVFSSTNLNSLQSHQQLLALHQYYPPLVCCSHRRNLFEPSRSHVMSLRDYYLSLQQRQQQQQNSYTLHRHSQLMRQQQQQLGASNEPQMSNHHHHHHHHHNHSQQQQHLHHHRLLQQQPPLSSSQYYNHKKQHQMRVAQTGNYQGNEAMRQHHKLVEDSHFQITPSDSYSNQQLHLKQQQQHQAVAANNIECHLASHQHHQAVVAIHRPQTKLARIRQNQFNNLPASRLYVSKDARIAATPSLISIGQTKLSSSDQSSGNSSDSSDESSNDWTESTMV